MTTGAGRPAILLTELQVLSILGVCPRMTGETVGLDHGTPGLGDPDLVFRHTAEMRSDVSKADPTRAQSPADPRPDVTAAAFAHTRVIVRGCGERLAPRVHLVTPTATGKSYSLECFQR